MKMIQKMLSIIALSALTMTFTHASPGQRSNKNIVEIAASNENFTTLVAAVKAANLVDALSAPGSLTVFAPTNSAFAKLPVGTVEALLANIPALTNILTYHVLGEEKSPSKLVKEKLARTLQGSDVRVCLDGSLELKINKSKVILKPIYASNGVIYIIDSVLIPQN